MAKLNLTPEQRAAVENRGGSLLVSAAAGSGKTKVLVERLFRYVLEEGQNVDDFLIITYTRAAAAELRGKIAEELNARLAQTPENGHLRAQLLRVYRADIKTVDAFCTALLRENAQLLPKDGYDHALTPDFRILDEQEAGLLRQKVLARVLEKFYDGLQPGSGAAELADTLGAGRDDRALEALVLEEYGKLQSQPYPDAWLRQQIGCWGALPEGIDETPYGKILTADAARKAHLWAELLRGAIGMAAGCDALEKRYVPQFTAAAESLDAYGTAAEMGWSAVAAREVTFGRLGAVKDEDGGADKVQMKNIWEQAKAESARLQEFFSVSAEEAIEDLWAVAPAMQALLRLTADFADAYQREKLRRNAADFSDQEHLAIGLLVDSDGAATQLGEIVAARYREIMVDEYQDTNEVQNCIFRAVSQGGKNLFTVGDVKQSIYRFRLADPGIFLAKYARFQDYSTAAAGEERKILLSMNFRSRWEVLDAANFVFENILSEEMGEMAYGAAEKLYCGASYYPAHGGCAPEFHLIDLQAQRGEATQRVRAAEVEAHFVARRIRQMLDEGFPVFDASAGAMRPVEAEDIVILMRSPSARLNAFTRTLAAYGIPCKAGHSEDFFAATEIAVMVALLETLDNPRQDVPLIAVLRSPLFGFTPDRLAELRARTPRGDFYDAVAADEGADARAFLAWLQELRRRAADMSVHQLLWCIANELNVLGIFGAMEGGRGRRKNLMTLFSWAENFEQMGYRGLFAFVAHLRRLLDSGERVENNEEGGSGVAIMSIHKSKGLEFPVIFLCDLAKKFNNMDFQNAVLTHPTLGIGPVRVDLARKIKYPTAARQAVELQLKREAKAEELRILYVAMTRPKEKLIMVDCMANAPAHLKKLLPVAACPVQPEIVGAQTCLGDWLLLPLLCREEAKPLWDIAEMPSPHLWTGNDCPWQVETHDGLAIGRAPHAAGVKSFSDVEEAALPDFSALDWTYPYGDAVAFPAKVTATQLKGRELDEEIAEGTALPPRLRSLRKPAFSQGKLPVSAAERGTATHLVMQYLDLARQDAAAVDRQIGSLRLRHLLTAEQAAAVDRTAIAGFTQSGLADEIRRARRVWREYRFSVLVPASAYIRGAAPEDEVLLQGVVDCFFETQDGTLTVVDFKTDHLAPGEETARAAEYRSQLTAYSEALSRIMEMPVGKMALYFFAANAAVYL